MSIEFFKLNNGNKIPAISIFGTGTEWYKGSHPSPINKELVKQIEYVLSLPGIVHIDIAQNYGTYPELGEALKNSKKPRDEIWITDKFSKLTKTPLEAIDHSLKTIGVDYVDLYLLHDPFYEKDKQGYDVTQAWKYLEQIYKDGKAKNIGVSNFGTDDLEKLLKNAEVKPVVNQIEFNAFLQNQTPGIYDFSQSHNILLEAYSPLGPLTAKSKEGGKGEFYEYVDQLSKKYSKSEGQILLRWVYQRGVLPVTTSSKIERVKASNDIFLFKLAEEEVKKITALGEQHPVFRQYWKPEYDKYN